MEFEFGEPRDGRNREWVGVWIGDAFAKDFERLEHGWILAGVVDVYQDGSVVWAGGWGLRMWKYVKRTK